MTIRSITGRPVDPALGLCEACPHASGIPAVRRIYATNFPDGYAVCNKHGHTKQGRYVQSTQQRSKR